MKTYFKLLLVALVTTFFVQGCQDNDDIVPPATLEIQDFIWKGMNQYYLWTDEVANLDENRFPNQGALNSFLQNYNKPEDLFAALRVSSDLDKFSWIVDDYLELEGQFQGTTNNNGVEFGLGRISAGSSEIFGFVRYIIPGSNASTKDIKRGDIFTGVNGTPLTISNYISLLYGANNDYTLNMANLVGNTLVANGKNIALTKTVLTENPILVNKVITVGSRKIGYLMYNAFTATFDTQLNNAFGTLKAQGITELVLDLRYNGGGSVQTATRLASMITGQFTGKIFAKQQWNKAINDYFEAEDPNALNNFFTDKIESTPINSLNLTKVYILTSSSSASASELVINGLKPHITVVQIGDVTVGKNVGSVTLYDSPTFGTENRNPKHRYAMQPIVLKIVNSLNFGEYQSGLRPDVSVIESIGNLGVLGDENEPLLRAAISRITNNARLIPQSKVTNFQAVSNPMENNGFNQMYLEKAPEGLLKALEQK
ncbi:S41 family peptidase [Flavobacterium sp. K77]|uniref:Peptidase S41 n=1 Tax=Flavobacterium turcicum TaxID=2764718 RepID=A0ABR7JHS0_9FLAO|nr:MULTISPECIES: S41 family peptidase [Flavobacterium]MBC5863918.1 peptidase S41 [Flavobacterium turcicum]MCF6140595.1 S41 family peptidase [Flavobacterium sp. K77]NHL02684.1 peptidase S41 [Flavobacterium turcicum]